MCVKSSVAGSPQASPGSALDVCSEFDAACNRTKAAMRELASRWRDVPDPVGRGGLDTGVSVAAAHAADKSETLTMDGFAWSKHVGLNFVLPQDALRGCAAMSSCRGRDGLVPSDVGGPCRPTHHGLLVAPTPPIGFGVFATEKLPRAAVLGEYVGELRDYSVWVEEIRVRKLDARGTDASAPYIPEELYAAWTGSGPSGAGVVVDASTAGNALRFVNCSCSPNCTFCSMGMGSQGHCRLQLVTKRVVEPWEQLSVDYSWYFDDLTRQDIRAQALEAYNTDRSAIVAVLSSLCGQAASDAATSPESVSDEGQYSEAVDVLRFAVRQVRGLPSGNAAAMFLMRFVDPEAVAILGESSFEACVPKARSFQEIPDAVWPLYEVVGAGRVGIQCRCGLDPSLNQRGLCSGIIGRPLQSKCSGREESECAMHWL
eukprot:TRINITY_DN70488_c0_g1_i1.p1 TRINITY_DN70488_c0_g1~~TRINITY_DN70488_c0_g1_i1.p1  ORF type:complete len:429 (+),score=53.69 TRINITY_DN70488_c0_g1_i1:74-1360(+)